MHKRMGKYDFIFLSVIFLLCMLCIYFFYGNREAGNIVLITIDGQKYGTYSLDQNQSIDIRIGDKVTNTLSIIDGKAKMTFSNCPDHLCEKQKEISKNGETIVCLPNKIVVQVENNINNDIDTIAN